MSVPQRRVIYFSGAMMIIDTAESKHPFRLDQEIVIEAEVPEAAEPPNRVMTLRSVYKLYFFAAGKPRAGWNDLQKWLQQKRWAVRPEKP